MYRNDQKPLVTIDWPSDQSVIREPAASIAGHVSRAMLSRYSHVRMEAKRRALDEIATRQNAADEKRREETERKRAAEAVLSQSTSVR
jgi:hypothetical protein